MMPGEDFKREYLGVPYIVDGETPDEAEAFDFSQKLVSFNKKRCLDCRGEGTVPSYNVRSVRVKCKECNGTGFLKDNSEHQTKHRVREKIGELIRTPGVSLNLESSLRNTLQQLQDDRVIYHFEIRRESDSVHMKIKTGHFPDKWMELSVNVTVGGKPDDRKP
jgi:hypothetical protein